MGNQKARSDPPAMRLVEHERKLEAAIDLYEKMFGTCVHGIYHEHHHTVAYLRGRLDGIKHAMRVMDL